MTKQPTPPPRRQSPTPPPSKPAPTAMQVIAEMPIGKLLVLLIPLLMFGGCCFTLMVGIVASQFDEGATTPQEAVGVVQEKAVAEEEAEELPSEAKVQVIVFNDTEKRPLDPKAEIWFRGLGSWWLANDTGPKTVGPRPIDELLKGDKTLVIYPSGRGLNDEGQRIDVPIKLSTAMNPEGSPRDAVTIEISDTEIKAWGLPVKAAIGKSEVVFPRN